MRDWDKLNASTDRTIQKKQHNEIDDSSLLAEIEAILEDKTIRTVFQPVVSLVDGMIAGYEALSRGPQGSLLEWPNRLFPAAEKFDKVWELEFLCRSKALEKAQKLSSDKMLFINVDPKIIHDARFQKGVTREMLAECKIDATNIIFEITEKTSIENYKDFRKVLDNYTSQGYKIAIDDTGSGYSGLKLLAETRPQYIKIDMDLVRDIDKDAVKQALMKAFYEFSVVTDMKIIAEGIETVDELSTLIQIGVPYGQGYFLQLPASEFLEIPPHIREYIIERNEQKRKEVFHTPLTIPVGEFARQDEAFLANVRGSKAIEFFNGNPYVAGIAIVHNGKPIGLLMKHRFLTHLATQYGVAVYMNRPVSLVMDRNPLIVDYYTPLEQVSKFAVSRAKDNLYDYIIITKSGQYHGITTVKTLLEKTTQLEINRAKHSNPLSGLPGNVLIEEKLKQVIESDGDYAVLYFDLDNFKAYNDIYGFENGDKVLCLTAQILQKYVAGLNNPEAFLGHIGGDDFIAVLPGMEVHELCKNIIENFDIRIRDFYTEGDHQRGYIVSKNRHGQEETFPIISLSIAVVTSQNQRFASPAELAEAAGAAKKQCKLTWHSCYFVA